MVRVICPNSKDCSVHNCNAKVPHEHTSFCDGICPFGVRCVSISEVPDVHKDCPEPGIKWYVLIEGSSGCTVAHPTEESARNEAFRLAHIPGNYNRRVFILTADEYCMYKPHPDVEWHIIEP